MRRLISGFLLASFSLHALVGPVSAEVLEIVNGECLRASGERIACPPGGIVFDVPAYQKLVQMLATGDYNAQRVDELLTQVAAAEKELKSLELAGVKDGEAAIALRIAIAKAEERDKLREWAVGVLTASLKDVREQLTEVRAELKEERRQQRIERLLGIIPLAGALLGFIFLKR